MRRLRPGTRLWIFSSPFIPRVRRACRQRQSEHCSGFGKFGKWRQPEDESLLGAPEAYVLSAAIDGWMKRESDEQIRRRAADAYYKYPNFGVKAACGCSLPADKELCTKTGVALPGHPRLRFSKLFHRHNRVAGSVASGLKQGRAEGHS